MTTKERLHQLIDLLPENEVPRIEEVLEAACASAEDGLGKRKRSTHAFTEYDALFRIVGIATARPGEPDDVSENVDAYLAEAYLTPGP